MYFKYFLVIIIFLLNTNQFQLLSQTKGPQLISIITYNDSGTDCSSPTTVLTNCPYNLYCEGEITRNSLYSTFNGEIKLFADFYNSSNNLITTVDVWAETNPLIIQTDILYSFPFSNFPSGIPYGEYEIQLRLVLIPSSLPSNVAISFNNSPPTLISLDIQSNFTLGIADCINYQPRINPDFSEGNINGTYLFYNISNFSVTPEQLQWKLSYTNGNMSSLAVGYGDTFSFRGRLNSSARMCLKIVNDNNICIRKICKPMADWALDGLNDDVSLSEDDISYKKEFYWNIYPNPTTSNLNIDFALKQDTTTDIYIFDTTGKQVHQQQHNGITGQNSIQLGLSSLPNGIYYVRANNDSFNKTERIVIQK